ncbi:MAG: peptidoglycan-binding domain-containing protein [Hyphomicrobiales bacterium]
MAPVTNAPNQTITITYSPQVEDVQRELMASGHFKGLVDGVMGPLTEQAVRQYQADNQLPVTGVVSSQLLERIRLRKKVAAATASHRFHFQTAKRAAQPQVQSLKAKPAAVTDGMPLACVMPSSCPEEAWLSESAGQRPAG